jgi:PadR family transcriptional regulator, regulatory protein AphA
MEHVVLGLLILQSLTLYELNQAFKQGISMFYSASYGSLQIAVKNLLGKGWIDFVEKVEKGRNKKIYSITEAGRQSFFAWMFAETPISKLEVTALAKVYFLGLIETRAQQAQIVEEIVSKIEGVQGELDSMNGALSQLELPPAYQEIFRYQQKTLDYGIQAHAFARRWFRSLLKDLREATQAAGPEQ